MKILPERYRYQLALHQRRWFFPFKVKRAPTGKAAENYELYLIRKKFWRFWTPSAISLLCYREGVFVGLLIEFLLAADAAKVEGILAKF